MGVGRGTDTSRVVVVGAGFVGLATALMLAERGVEATVLERDPDSAPASPERAVTDWGRRGVAQFRQAHMLAPRGHEVLRRRLPAVAAAVERAGGRRVDLMALMPETVSDPGRRPGDERFTTVTARRPVLEHVLASCAEGLDVRRGVGVEHLLTGPEHAPGVPHVTGVRTSSGEDLPADLVVDATGRSSRFPDLLAELGARPVREQREAGTFTYYTRFFTARPGAAPPAITPLPHGGLVQFFDSYALIHLPGDGDTWSVTAYITSHDRALRELRHPDTWTALIRSCPEQAHLVDGEPLTDVLPISGSANRWRDVLVDGEPVVTGFAAVGDALCCTDPMVGRGMTLGLLQAESLVDAAADHLDRPVALLETYAAAVESRVLPWYHDTVAVLQTFHEMSQAAVEGREPAPEAVAADAQQRALFTAMTRDADVFRAHLDMVTVQATAAEIFTRPGFADRVAAAAVEPAATSAPGPSRAALLAELAAA